MCPCAGTCGERAASRISGAPPNDDPFSQRDVARDLHQTRLAIAKLDRASFEAFAGHLNEDDRLSCIVDDGAVGHRDRLDGCGHEDAQRYGLSDGQPRVRVGELVNDRHGPGVGIQHAANGNQAVERHRRGDPRHLQFRSDQLVHP